MGTIKVKTFKTVHIYGHIGGDINSIVCKCSGFTREHGKTSVTERVCSW